MFAAIAFFPGETVVGDVTDPIIASSTYTDGTQSLAVTVTETNPSRLYWALVTNPSTPSAAQIVAGTGGGILEAGDVSIVGGTFSGNISVTNEAGDEIHLVATDTSGNQSTVDIVTGVTVDNSAPTISTSDPADNATDHPVGDSITITFNENIALGTGNIVLRENNGGWADLETFDAASDVGASDGQVQVSGAVLTINPTGSLTASREYAVRIAATAIDDSYGNSFAGIADDTTLSFTTEAASSPSATLIHSSESGSFVTTHNFSVGALTAGDYIAFVGVEQPSRTLDSATLEGSAMTAFTSGAVAGSSISMNAFYITGLAGGGNETLSVTLDASTSGCWCQLIKINDGTIVTTALTDSASATPPDLDVTFTNSADELMIVGWIHASNTSPFSSYDGLTALQAATNGAECAYGSGSGNATAGTPDTVGVNFSAAFANAACVGIRVT